ncbi:MAG: AmmeMemoRadiSam system radical SAM enzyme [Candidatus Helarchaeota archaeon]|nr:AmmeMemoRadiSam system radical SAM enzyme [Candidatus Helarchaeota archaeon]
MHESPFVKESLLFENIDPDTVRCATCERRCKISKGKVGFCKTRINLNGKLHALTYGNISSISNNPIEKKPLYHFFPGTKALTVGTWGCNFTCPFCQNWEISKTPPIDHSSRYLSPDRFLELAKKFKSQGTSFSLNEPTLLIEYAIDVMKLTRPLDYYQTYVTNLFMTEEALNLLINNGCDAFCVNVKGDQSFYKKRCTANSDVVWRNLQIAKERGAHVEIVTLVIPNENDSEDVLRSIAKKIKTLLGENIPWHCNQYHPDYKAIDTGLANYRTPVKTLKKAYKIGREEGLNYVYIGNIHGHELENTFCPNCETLLIERTIFGTEKNNLKDGNSCPQCGESIPIVTSLKNQSN